MTVQQIVSFKTSDKRIFEKKSNAMAHEARLKAIKYFDANKLYGVWEGAVADGSLIIDFIDEHRIEVEKYLRRTAK